MAITDFTVTHRIEAPELTAALNNLADALRGRPLTASAVTEDKPEVPATTEATVAAPVAPAAPVVAPPIAPAPAPAQVPAPAARAYTFEDITNAGSQLLEQGKMPQLMDLLATSFGVQAVTQLRPDQYPDVAAALVRLGAKI